MQGLVILKQKWYTIDSNFVKGKRVPDMSTPETGDINKAFSSGAAMTLGLAALDYQDVGEFLHMLQHGNTESEDYMLREDVKRAGATIVRFEFPQAHSPQATAARELFGDGAAPALYLAKEHFPLDIRQRMHDLADSPALAEGVQPNTIAHSEEARLIRIADRGHRDAHPFAQLLGEWSRAVIETHPVATPEYCRYFYRGFGYVYRLMVRGVQDYQDEAEVAARKEVLQAVNDMGAVGIDKFDEAAQKFFFAKD